MQLSSYDRLTPENIIFNEAKEFKVKDSKIKYKRIPIEVKYPNGKKGARLEIFASIRANFFRDRAKTGS